MEAPVIALVGSILAVAGTVFLFWRDKLLEKKSINKAILAEVQRLLQVIREHYDWPGRRDQRYPLIVFSTPVYHEHLKNIGHLDDDIVVLVVKFYGYLGYINVLQTLRPQYPSAADKTPEFDKQYEQSLARLLQDYEGKFDQAFDRYNCKQEHRAPPNTPLQPAAEKRGG